MLLKRPWALLRSITDFRHKSKENDTSLERALIVYIGLSARRMVIRQALKFVVVRYPPMISMPFNTWLKLGALCGSMKTAPSSTTRLS